MKTMHKGLVASLVLAAAGLTVWSAAAGRLREAPPGEQAPTAAESENAVDARAAKPDAPAAAPAGESAPVAAREPGSGGTNAAVYDTTDTAPRAASEGEPVDAPADLKVTVRDTRAGRVIRVRRPGHLLAIRRGADRRIGMHEVTWTVEKGAGDEGRDGDLVWESTHPKTLETLRGRLSVGADGKAGVEKTIRMDVLSEDSAAHHRCAGHSDGEGGFVVLCRVQGGAAAASIDGGDPKQGVWAMAGETTLVRFDLPMSGDGATARMLGYERGGKGVVVRAEASRAPGESAAVLALASDERSQPQPVRPVGCFCHLPVRPTFDGGL